jgi:hypothetical protein
MSYLTKISIFSLTLFETQKNHKSANKKDCIVHKANPSDHISDGALIYLSPCTDNNDETVPPPKKKETAGNWF